MNEKFQLETRTSLFCQIDKFDGYEDGIVSLVNICRAIVVGTTTDFVMLSNGEKGLVQRANSKLYLNDGDKFWVEKWESNLNSQNYEFVRLPSL